MNLLKDLLNRFVAGLVVGTLVVGGGMVLGKYVLRPAGTAISAVWEDAVRETRVDSVSRKMLDDTIAEFLAIEPRTEWQPEFDMSNKQITTWYLSGFEERGLQLSDAQRKFVLETVAPRIKELTARAYDRLRARGVQLNELEAEMTRESDADMERFAPAIAAMLLAIS